MRVLLVGGDPLARGGLAGLLLGEGGVTIAGQVSPDRQALDDAPPHDARAWDLGLDPGAGVARFRQLGGGDVPAVALAASEEGAAEVIQAGARGVVARDADGPRLVAALRATLQGLVVVDEAWAGTVLSPRSGPMGDVALSPREQEVLQLLAEGHPNKIIADRLGISDHTAKFHINSIFAKLGAQSRTEAVVRAVRLGWLSL